MYKFKVPKPESMPIIGSILACLYWFIDSAVDTFLFNTQTLYIESLLDPGVIELWSRCQVILLLMAFSLTAMLMPRRHHKTRALLGQYKHKLDYVMNTNMNDLYTKNTIFYTVHRLFNKLKSSIIY